MVIFRRDKIDNFSLAVRDIHNYIVVERNRWYMSTSLRTLKGVGEKTEKLFAK